MEQTLFTAAVGPVAKTSNGAFSANRNYAAFALKPDTHAKIHMRSSVAPNSSFIATNQPALQARSSRLSLIEMKIKEKPQLRAKTLNLPSLFQVIGEANRSPQIYPVAEDITGFEGKSFNYMPPKKAKKEGEEEEEKPVVNYGEKIDDLATASVS